MWFTSKEYDGHINKEKIVTNYGFIYQPSSLYVWFCINFICAKSKFPVCFDCFKTQIRYQKRHNEYIQFNLSKYSFNVTQLSPAGALNYTESLPKKEDFW